MTLTARQREVHSYWRKYQESHFGIPPSIRDALSALGGASTESIYCHIRVLLKKGAFVRVLEPNESRGIVAVELEQEIITTGVAP